MTGFAKRHRRHPKFASVEVAQRWTITKLQAQRLQKLTRDAGGVATYLAIRRGFVGVSRFKVCQWIEGDPGPTDACKCRLPTSGGDAYCKRHAIIAYVGDE